MAILLWSGATPVTAKESKNLALPLVGAEESANALAAARAISAAAGSGTLTATLRRTAKSVKSAAGAESAIASVRKLVSAARVALALSRAPAEISAGASDVHTATSLLDMPELVALVYAIFQGGDGDESLLARTAVLLASVGAIAIPKLRARTYEGQVRIILWGCARAGASIPPLLSEMLRACDLVIDWSPTWGGSQEALKQA